ncbi:hypothetical protein D9758_013208 [Tetrapyrgos nigripes]|uniref:F-box domain-containing protein n=1 Tax=Tetrapyrgos nigripes TaxID=182062 RepID=A0A8H5CRN2_9AGAR|nr:hypothetical protein D9758_013208 [Tetrapyrgos nigripes]
MSLRDVPIQQLAHALLYKVKRRREELAEMPIAEIDAVERKLHVIAAAIRGHRNTLQPVNRLPPEILSIIFEHAQLSLSPFLPNIHMYSQEGSEWHSLLHVCRHWRGVIAQTSFLWSTVDSSTLTAPYLRRSGGSPLTIFLRSPAGLTKEHLDILLPHVSRIKELHFSCPSWDENNSIFDNPTLLTPAPLLQSLSVINPYNAFVRDFWSLLTSVRATMPQLFSGETPKLKHLFLEHFTSWPSNSFTNLTHVCLFNQDRDTLPTTSAFLDFLEGSPKLEELSLIRAGPLLPDEFDHPLSVDPVLLGQPSSQDENTISDRSSRIISLPSLRELNLGFFPETSYIARLLSHLSIPPETDMYMWGDVFISRDRHLNRSLILPVDTSRLANVQSITTWYLTHYRYSATRSGQFLYAPFHAITGVRASDEPPLSSSSTAPFTAHLGTRSSSSWGGNLYTYGVYSPSNLLDSLPRYPLHNITTFVIRDSASQPDAFRTDDWITIFREMVLLEKLRILAVHSPETTRTVLTALIPVQIGAIGSGGSGRVGSGHGFAYVLPSTSASAYVSTSRLTDTMDNGNVITPQLLLCPHLKSIMIEHESDLPAILLAKVIESRKDVGAAIEMVRVMVHTPCRQCDPHTNDWDWRDMNTANGIYDTYTEGVDDHESVEGRGTWQPVWQHGPGRAHDSNRSDGSPDTDAYPLVHSAARLSTVLEEDLDTDASPTDDDGDASEDHSNSSAYHSISDPPSSEHDHDHDHEYQRRHSRDTQTMEPHFCSEAEYQGRLRSYEHLDLLRKYMEDIEFEFVSPESLSWDLIPPKWPPEALKRTRARELHRAT